MYGGETGPGQRNSEVYVLDMTKLVSEQLNMTPFSLSGETILMVHCYYWCTCALIRPKKCVASISLL